MANISLFIGRFQPFHNGHLSVIKGMVKVNDKVIVGIGSSNTHGTPDDPFTREERREMIQRALQDENIIPLRDVSFVNLPDMPEDEAWAKMCLEICENKITAVWTGNEWTKKSFASAGVKIQDIKEVPGLSATEVRRRMKVGEDWKSLVPEVVADYIREIDGVSRV
ncbi:MAG: nicotinamide-nucleotide adenylyltransferase [Candidatus Uhrbacteria bacterium]